MAVMQEYKCPCCDGAIAFDPSVQKMKCPYCETEFDLETLKSYDQVLSNEGRDSMEWDLESEQTWQPGETDGMRIYACRSCGGEIVGDENTAATSCPYCGNPVVMMGQFAGDLKPDLVIPFKLDKKAAKDGLLKHLSGKPLLPKVFKDQNHIDEIKGIYVPFWLYDAEAQGTVNYKATRTRHWSDSDYNYTEVSHYSAIRGGSLAFSNVPADGSSKMADDLMDSIEPFDYNDGVAFQTAYLAGYFADKYDVSAEDCIPRINRRIKQSTEQAFASTVTGYDTVNTQNSSVCLSKSSARYALLPVWLLNTTWRGEKYTFAMNGQTGKFVGNLPIDKGAFWRWFILTGLISAAAVFGIIMLFMNM